MYFILPLPCTLFQSSKSIKFGHRPYSSYEKNMYLITMYSIPLYLITAPLFWIGKNLRVYLKPILPILSYEVLQHCSILDQASILKFTDFQNDNLKDRFQDIIAIRRCLNQHKVKKSDCVNVGIDLGLSLEDLAEIWQVAFVAQNGANNLKSTTFDINGIPVDVIPSGMKACPRCRLFRSPTEKDLCERCQLSSASKLSTL